MEAVNWNAGFSIAAMEVDGKAWVAVGAPGNMQGDFFPGEARGAAHFYQEPLAGDLLPSDAELSVVGS